MTPKAAAKINRAFNELCDSEDISTEQAIEPPPSEGAMETAREIIEKVRAQNWKNGGVLSMDNDEAEQIVAAALDAARAEEREACARVADNHAWPHRAAVAFWGIERGSISAAIRARSSGGEP